MVSLVGWSAADRSTVHVELSDADGETWDFAVPASLMTDDPTVDVAFPRGGSLPCTIVRDEIVGGILMVHIDTEQPAGLRSVDGMSRFRVLRAMVP